MVAASGFREVAQQLTSRLDLPDTAPTGVTWSPFVTGFPFGEWYVVARTIADEQASRAGMVFSHALLAPLDQISEFSNLRQICSHLLAATTSTGTLAPIEIDPAAPDAQGFDAEAVETVNLLISSSKKPVVRLGTDGFEDLICNLWPKFWPELRRNFTFRLSFGPNDLVEVPLPLLVCTPANLAARWSHFPLIAGNGTSDRSSPAADLLIGDGQQTVGPQPLIKALGIQITTFPELALLNRLHDLYSAGTLNLDTDVAKARLIDALSRGEKRHAIGRDDLIEEVAKQILAATPQQIRSLRNLELRAFEKAPQLWASVERWVSVYSYPPREDAHSLELLIDAYDPEKALPSWQASVKGGLANSQRPATEGLRHAFWRFVEIADATKVSPLMTSLTAGQISEEQVLSASPAKLTSDTIPLFLEEAATRGRLKLHAIFASAKYSPTDAARMQLAADRKLSDPAALGLAVRNASAAELVAIALELKRDPLIELAAELAAASPDALAAIDPLNETVQKVWARVLEKNRSAWRGPNNPEECITLLLDELLSHKTSELSHLLSLLADTPLADLRSYKKRSGAWTQLDSKTREKFIARTGQGFMEGIRPDDSTPLEAELQKYILQSADLSLAVTRAITRSTGESSLRLLSELTLMEDSRFQQLAHILNATRLSVAQATSLGQLINVRRWGQSAQSLVHLARQGREDIKAVLRECQGLLGFWDRLKLGLNIFNADEKWNSFADLGADLYPEGPRDREVWQRAGGKNADLVTHGDGRMRWYDAVYKVRRGNRVRSWELLDMMREDFGWNEDLRALSNDPEFRRHGGA